MFTSHSTETHTGKNGAPQPQLQHPTQVSGQLHTKYMLSPKETTVQCYWTAERNEHGGSLDITAKLNSFLTM
jgi:hypothetical protein